MSPTPSDLSQTTPSSPPGDDDPLAHLHKMSTTAGLGSGDYVEVNASAVLTLLLGLASALALLANVLLVIPLLAIVVSVIAVRQIRHSNGTQTGLGLVALGVALGLLFGGIVGTLWATEGLRTRDDRRAISQLVSQLAETARAANYDQAYQLFSTRFQEHTPPAQFKERMTTFTENAVYGKLKETSAGLMQFHSDEATGARFAIVRVYINFEKTERPLSDDLTMRKDQDQWRIEAFPVLFPPAQRERGQGQ